MQTQTIDVCRSPCPTGPPAHVELADILRVHGDEYLQSHPASPQQRKAIRDILRCRTPVLGGHLESCQDQCGFQRLSFHSCRNRHCPKCQSLKKLQWVYQRLQRLLPTRYFHVVVTLPHELNPLISRNQRTLYDLFFEAATKALLELAQRWSRLQALPGFTAVLHTWNQDLMFHVHLHLIVTAGGLDRDGTRWTPAKNNFLVPVKALAKMLRGKFLQGLGQLFDESKLCFPQAMGNLEKPPAFRRFIRSLRRKKWYAYSKAPFDSPKHVFSYLGHYTHRVAISNQRLVAFEGESVTFRARNNEQPGTKRLVSLNARDFVQRFLRHVLPPQFVRIRHFGLFAPGNTHTKLERAREIIEARPDHTIPDLDIIGTGDGLPVDWKRLLFEVTGFDVTVCPACGAKLIREPIPATATHTPHPFFPVPVLNSS